VNLFTKKAHQYKKGVKTGDYEETDIPDESKELFDRYYAELIESISATDDTLLEHYLEGGEISREEAITAMKEAMKRMELFPLFVVSSELNYGMQAILSTVVDLMPNAFEMEELHAF
jgi:elongation factor G